MKNIFKELAEEKNPRFWADKENGYQYSTTLKDVETNGFKNYENIPDALVRLLFRVLVIYPPDDGRRRRHAQQVRDQENDNQHT